jgi:hypothetical protein
MERKCAPKHAEATADASGNAMVTPYLTTSEVARCLRWSKRTLRAKVRAGVFRQGVHFFRRPGCQVLWKWAAIVRWLEADPTYTPVVDELLFE